MQEFTQRWRTRLLAAQTDLIDAYGGCRRVVENLEISRSQVGRWYGGIDRDVMPTPIVMALEGDGNVGRPIVSAIPIEFLGLEVSGASERGADLACISGLNADLVAASGEMMVETVRAKADGIVTPGEAQRLRVLSRKIERIRAQIDDVLAGAEAREGLSVVRGGAAS